MKVTFLKTYHEAREKAFVLVLMLEMLFQKTEEKLVIDGRSVHHTVFKWTLGEAAFSEMLWWKFRLSERPG